MASSTPVLWQIKVSHYNEKARWALDYKRVPHRRRAPLPLFGTAPAAWLMTRGVTCPVLRLDGRAIGDSTRIVAALEERFPDPPLYPADPAQRARALELEDFFDEQLAPYVRRLGWWHLTQHPRELFVAAFPDSSPLVRAALRPGAAVTTVAMRRRYGLTEASAAEARAKVLAAMDRIEAEIGPSGYLVGDAFSIADLTAAALATPFVRPPERQYLPPEPPPEPLRSFGQQLEARPAGRWVLDIYRRHRGVSAEVKRSGATVQAPPSAAVSA
ncbi:MAG TPA: glutathione S-transferase family protein [Conexibacter sp.]|nr:glutathione S-transferase family protein [Conexibacter sp.]